MALLRRLAVAGSLLIALGLALPGARSQPTNPAPPGQLAAAEPLTRLVYAVHGGAAPDLASVLSLHFQAEPSFRVIADPVSNSLLLSGPKATLSDALTVLRTIDRPARTIHLEILLVTLAGGDAKALEGSELSGDARDVMARLRALQQKGVLTSVKTVQLTTVQRQTANARLSESRPFVAGVTAFGGRGGRGGGPGDVTSRSITYREVGTNVQVVPEIGSDGVVSLRLVVEDSHLRPAEGGVAIGTDEKGIAVPATEVVQTNLETTLRVRPGQMVVAQGTKTGSKAGLAQTILLITASIDEASPKDGK